MNSRRMCLLVVILLFVAALFAPVSQVTTASRLVRESVDVVPGWRVLRFGWMGPLGLTFGWYANIPLAVCAWRMLLGRSPGRWAARVGGLLAASSLLPFAMYSEVDGMHRAYVRGTGVWLWLGVFAVLLVEAESEWRQEHGTPPDGLA